MLQSMEGGEGWLQGLGAAAGQGWGWSCPPHPRRDGCALEGLWGQDKCVTREERTPLLTRLPGAQG